YDPAVAHRAALRALVAERVFSSIRPGHDPSEVIAAAALADIDLTVSRPADPEAAHQATRSLLGSTMVGRIPGLRNVATAIGAHHERWDGDGSPDGLSGADIPLTARVVAVADSLVGNPAAGFVPTWTHALRRVRRNRGTSLDPELCDALEGIDVDDIESPAIPSATLLDLLERMAVADSIVEGTQTATTIRTAVASAADIDDLLTLFADTALRTVAAAEVAVMKLTPTQIDPEPIARSVDGDGPLDLERLDDLRDFTMQAELRAGVTLSRSTQDSESDPDEAHIDEVIVPIMLGEETWGIVVATRRPDNAPFDEHDRSILRHIASEAAAAVSSTNRWAAVEHMALRDQLTGLANRHELYRVLDELFERPPLDRVDSALIMCDVDGLKVINDTQGHHAGDRLLIDAAAALRGAVRAPERSTICRIGGDEFCLLIDGGALLTAHDVSDMIERLFARSAGSGTPRSISCGIAFASEDIETRSALLRAADENQYQTKRARKAEREEQLIAIAASADGQLVDRRAIRD
ncbi:MAG: diguanylate cyclase (GGDEF)-like protein, partial [Verrucomicrobiales bacterium]